MTQNRSFLRSKEILSAPSTEIAPGNPEAGLWHPTAARCVYNTFVGALSSSRSLSPPSPKCLEHWTNRFFLASRSKRTESRKTLYTALHRLTLPRGRYTKKRIIPFVRARREELSPRGEAGARLPARSTSFPHDVCFLASRYEGKMFLSRGRRHCWPSAWSHTWRFAYGTLPTSSLIFYICVFLYTSCRWNSVTRGKELRGQIVSWLARCTCIEPS